MRRTRRDAEIPLPGLEETPVGYRASTIARLVGISYRQLDYWTTKELVRASGRDADGSGSQRLYRFTDIVELRVIKRLLDTGVSLDKVRAAITHLRDRGLDLRRLTLVSDGTTVYALDDERRVVDLLQQDQGVFAIALDPLITQLEGEIAGLDVQRTEPPPVAASATRLADEADAS